MIIEENPPFVLPPRHHEKLMRVFTEGYEKTAKNRCSKMAIFWRKVKNAKLTICELERYR